MNELVDQFKTIAVRAGFDNTYIDTAVKNIYSTEKESMAGTEISEYLKTLPSDMCEDPSKDQFRSSHDQWSNDEGTGIVRLGVKFCEVVVYMIFEPQWCENGSFFVELGMSESLGCGVWCSCPDVHLLHFW